MRAATTAVVAVGVLLAGCFTTAARASTDPNLTVGTLGTELSTPAQEAQAATENADGIQGAEIDLNWADLETGNNTWSASAFSAVDTQIQNAIKAGEYITIDLGLQN